MESKRFERKREGKSKEVLAQERKQKSAIIEMLNEEKEALEEAWQHTKATGRALFEIRYRSDLAGGVLSNERVADILRQWIFETYGNKLGLYSYDGKNYVRFTVE